MENCSFTILLSSHKNLSHIFAHMEDGGTHISNLCTKPKALQQKVGFKSSTHCTASFFQRSATYVCVSACVCVVWIYLREVVNVSMVHYVQSINSSSESVDLLMRISHQDFPTTLREKYIYDDWIGEREEEDIIAKQLSKIKRDWIGRVITWSTILGLIDEDHIILVRQPRLWRLELP